MTTKPDWNKIMNGYGGARPDANECVVVTRGTARLANSALRSQNAADYYHNYGAAEVELKNAMESKSPSAMTDLYDALDNSSSLLTAMLLEKRPDEEIEAQISENRAVLNSAKFADKNGDRA